ncbi:MULTISPECIES: hypothetical protein [Pseudomonas]|uniref:hypothetical protein n=1 Tax=Pseudomonas TaxID=286 RepID=UPI0012901FB1|nr:hypothetical protein [Pseudomonas fragi]NNB23881.1 hypothetical protein [Pseudomonas fragi]
MIFAPRIDREYQILGAIGRVLVASQLGDGIKVTVQFSSKQAVNDQEAFSRVVDELAALVRQLVHQLGKVAPDSDLPAKALD